jgi:cell division protein FtsI (penicillin-binding protein 3)
VKGIQTKISLVFRKRLVWVAFFIFFLFCLLVIQFYKVQIIEGDKWTKIAETQHRYLVKQSFMRGSFFSNLSIKDGHPNQSQPLVMDVPKFHLFIDPIAIPQNHKIYIARKIYEFGLLNKNKYSKIQQQFFLKKRSRKIVSWIDLEKKNIIEKWWVSYAKKEKIPKNAIFFVQDYKRSYPFGKLLGQLLHTVREDKDGKTFRSFPTGGLETYFDKYLQGKMGSKLILRSPKHRLDTIKVIDKAENGADIYLTINHYIQAIAEEELAKGVKKVNAKGGWAIVMDPYTGEIWALAQYPFFNPLEYAKYFNDPEKMEHSRVKAAMDAFEPGSIFKPITLAICMRADEELMRLEKKSLFIPEEMIPTSNGAFPGRSKPLKDGRRHEYLNMYLGIQKSSNIYVGKIVHRVIERFGDNWYKRALENIFGFGKKTNIEVPAENAGLVPSPGKLHPNGKLEWSLSTPYSLAMGHNILVNSIQIIKAYGIIANKGFDIKPTLVKKISRTSLGNEKILLDNRKKSESIRLLSEVSCNKLIKAMKFTTKLGGTAHTADIMGYTEAGKTGTSEKIIDGKYSKSKHISSFVGIAPANKPRFVLMVVIDEPEKKFVPGLGKTQSGGVCAGPIFEEIGKRIFQYLGVAPDDPFGYPYGDPRRDVKKSDWFKEMKELKASYNKWNHKK